MRPLQKIRTFCAVAALVGGLAVSAYAAEKDADAEKYGVMQSLFGDTVDHFSLQPFTVSVIRDGKITNLVSFGIVIETIGMANQEKVMENHLRIHDAFLRELYSVMSFQHGDGQGIDSHLMKMRLMRAGERVLGAGVINDILVRNLVNRPLL